MNNAQMISGVVLSHTTIRVAGKGHADNVPFTLLLVATDNGRNLLGQFDEMEPPAIGTKVEASSNADTLVFRKATEQK